jgi:hypothetical protein
MFWQQNRDFTKSEHTAHSKRLRKKVVAWSVCEVMGRENESRLGVGRKCFFYKQKRKNVLLQGSRKNLEKSTTASQTL